VSLSHLLVFVILSLVLGRIASARWRGRFLLAASGLAMYWLQPAIPIRHLDFWLPTATLALSVLVWASTAPGVEVDEDKRCLQQRQNRITALTLGGLVLVIALLRYTQPLCCLTPTIPPAVHQVLLALALAAGIGWAARRISGRRPWLHALTLVLLAVFVVLKSEFLAQAASSGLRLLNGQPTATASALDLRWLGFSYVAFRLIHSLRDRLDGRLPELSLEEFIIYILFFPAFTAGPIDRVQRFIQDLRRPFRLGLEDALAAGRRLLIGVFNKFVLADFLAIIALNAVNATQAHATGWLWILLYAYAFRIYFDFAGYTDIAIGLGGLLGIRLPENFDHPYQKPNPTLFWNSWHMTLAQWLRGYYFNPLTRSLRMIKQGQSSLLPLPLIIFIGQVTTMLFIGLWHGLTWNFAIWGLWHGLGLFIHNRYADWSRPRLAWLDERPGLKRLSELGSVLLNFHFVTLGWVWFALPTPALAWQTLLKLFGG